ncbi:uncharacterized protein RB166_013812 [Leptodactylus fuscus]|uniref:uncharacterized protein LOC142213431 n=1 Tax=Leptodactylus fuscus TaxID=238119 RepID=UPI003F4E9B7C
MSHDYGVILLFTLLKCVFCYDSCGDSKNISALEGDNVILQVDEKGFTEISWVFQNAHIATTKPNSSIDIKGRDYKSKLYNKGDGSLGITKITLKDSGTFVASIFKEEETCSQTYQLTVYSNFSRHDLQIHHNISRDEICFITCVVNKPGVKTTWSRENSKHTTLHNSTLRVDPTERNLTWVCTAANKVLNVSKTFEPATLCHDGSFMDHTRAKQANVVTVVVLMLVLLIISVACAYYFRKKIKFRDPSSVTYIKPETVPVPEVNPYCEIEFTRDLPDLTVGHTKKQASEPGESAVHTIYATIPSPTMGQDRKQVLLDPVYSTIKNY